MSSPMPFLSKCTRVEMTSRYMLLVEVEKKIAEAKAKHNQYLSELGLPPI
jgi:hypothetical protein